MEDRSMKKDNIDIMIHMPVSKAILKLAIPSVLSTIIALTWMTRRETFLTLCCVFGLQERFWLARGCG